MLTPFEPVLRFDATIVCAPAAFVAIIRKPMPVLALLYRSMTNAKLRSFVSVYPFTLTELLALLVTPHAEGTTCVTSTRLNTKASAMFVSDVGTPPAVVPIEYM